MEKLIEVVTSYHLFNYLLPGALFVIMGDTLGLTHLEQGDLVKDGFVYYFAGLVISRIGSLIIEPTLKGLRFVKYVPYKDYVAAAKNDATLVALSEANNAYRTYVSLFACVGLLLLAEWTTAQFGVVAPQPGASLLVFLLVLFLASYRKQSSYVAARATKGGSAT